jgi:ATP-binding cassette, subfamily B, bacterial
MGEIRQPRQRPVGAWRVLRSFWPYVWKQWAVLSGAFLALMGEVALRLMEPWPLKIVFDFVLIPTQDALPTLPVVGTLGSVTVLVLATISIVLVIGLRALASFAHTVGFALAGNSVCRELRDALFRHVQRLPISFHTRTRGGDLLLRVIGDAGMLRDVVVTAAMPLVANVLVFASMLGMMFWLRWDLALLAVAPAPLFFISTRKISGRISEVSRKHRQTESALAASASEAIGAIRTVQALSLEERFSSGFHEQAHKGMKNGVQATRLSARLERSTDLLIAVGTALVVLYGARLVQRGLLTPGDLIVFLAYLKNAFKPIKDVAKYTGRVAKARAAAERIVDILNVVPAIRNLPDARNLSDVRGAIRFERVGFGYDDRLPILQGLDFEIHPGESVALVGQSGNGKSTIASLLVRLHDPTLGRVLIDQCDIREYTLESLRTQIATVFPDSPLFAATIRENIAMGASRPSDGDIVEAARLAGALEFIERLPQGFHTVVGERGLTLSQGQRQRLTLARAAVRHAPIMVLDEPTTGLDEENQRVVMSAIDGLSRGRTVLLITHDLALAARADRVLYLEAGHVVEQGTFAQLMMAGGRYARLYRMQVDERASSAAQIPHAV